MRVGRKSTGETAKTPLIGASGSRACCTSSQTNFNRAVESSRSFGVSMSCPNRSLCIPDSSAPLPLRNFSLATPAWPTPERQRKTASEPPEKCSGALPGGEASTVRATGTSWRMPRSCSWPSVPSSRKSGASLRFTCCRESSARATLQAASTSPQRDVSPRSSQSLAA